MKSLIQCNGVAFEADDQKWTAKGILRLNVYEEDFEYMTPVIQPYPRSAIKAWSDLHNPELSSLPVTIIFDHAVSQDIYGFADQEKPAWEEVAYQCYKDNQLCVTDQAVEPLSIESVMLYLWHETRKAEWRIGRKLKCNNATCVHSVMRTIKQQGVHKLLNVSVTDETIGLVFKHIFIGVEHDGYAHS